VTKILLSRESFLTHSHHANLLS